jgi:predicted TIM-barrel enzyme
VDTKVLPIVRKTPVLAGVCGTDPFRRMQVFLAQSRDLSFAGVQNFPTVGLIVRALPQEPGRDRHGIGLEIEMIRTARPMEMLTCPYVFTTGFVAQTGACAP